jgi:hypothetical protein
MKKPEKDEVATFWYSFHGRLDTDYESFVLKHRRILSKIGRYRYEQWSEAITDTGDLVDALITLNLRNGPIPTKNGYPTTNERLGLLSVWEKKWGELPRKYRIGFVRNPKFKLFVSIDLEILVQLFQQHKKFDSVIDHINSFRRGEMDFTLGDLDSLSNSFNDEGSMVTIDGDSWFGSEDAPTEDIINSLSSDIRLDGEWNIDELDSEEIIFAIEDPQEQF